MTIIICPTCESHLIEQDKRGKLDCLMCADNFALEDAKIGYMSYSQIYKWMRENKPHELGGVKEQPEPKQKTYKQRIVEETIYQVEQENKMAVRGQEDGRKSYLKMVESLKKREV